MSQDTTEPATATDAIQTIEGYPLSSEQKAAFALGAAQQPAWVVASFGVDPPLEIDRLDRALAAVCTRHEILRTRFVRLPGMGLPLQAIAERSAPVTVACPASQPASVPGSTLDDLPLVHCTLAADAAGHSIVSLALPAMMADLFSLRDLIVELGQAYDGGGFADEPLQYADYASWQIEFVAGEASAESRAYWRQFEAGVPSTSVLPFDGSAPADEPIGHGRLDAWIDLSPPPASDVAAEVAGVSRSTLLHAAWQIVLWRLTGEPTIATFGWLDGRGHEPLRGAIGRFCRLVPFPVRIPADLRGTDLFAAIDRLSEAHHAHALALDPTGQPALLPPADGGACAFAFHDWREAGFGGRRLRVIDLDADDQTCALRLTAIEDAGGARLRLDFDRRRFAAPDMHRLLDCYRVLAADLAQRPEIPVGDLRLLDDPSRRQIAACGRGPALAVAPIMMPARFAAAAASTPERTAVVCGDQTLTFAACNRRANQLAHRLRALGVGPEAVVGLCLPRGVDAIAAVLGIWNAGGAYLPLDAELPGRRLLLLLEESRAQVLVTLPSIAARLPSFAGTVVVLDGDPPSPGLHSDPPAPTRAGDLAYVLYTSGSSGRPRGVMVQHGSLANLAAALDLAVYQGRPQLSIGLGASLAFDASVKQLIQLCLGHTLHVLSDATRLDARALADYVEREQLDVLDATPTQLRLLLAGHASLAGHTATWLVGGEPIDGALWRALASSPRGAFNLYGPTECTVDTTVAAVRDAAAAPTIGRPLANIHVHVLDARLQPVPPGVTGELCIGGAGVARGYLGDPASTAACFVPDPFAVEPGARMYRSGDRVAMADDGSLGFRGRADFQVKLRGVRIELEEIERVLGEHPAVAAAACALHDTEGADPRLVAHVVPRRAHAAVIEGRQRHPLPNGLAIVHQNKNETDYLYRELFAERLYIRHGVQLPRSGVIFDVGANIGMFTLFAQLHSPDARVFAFEPLAPLFELLSTNCALYAPEVQRLPYGLSDRAQSAAFTFYDRYSMMSGRADYADPDGELALIKTFLHNQRSTGDADAAVLLAHADPLLQGRFTGQRHDVELRRLSDVLRDHRIDRISLLKIDVQRAELDVLQGIDEADWDRIDQLVIEVHDGASKPTAGRLWQMTTSLARRGFTLAVDQDPLLAGTDRHNLYAWRSDRPVLAAEPSRARDLQALPRPVHAAELLDHLLERLPAYMLPDQVVLHADLPRTLSGKVDRRALVAAALPARAASASYAEPRNDTERRIAAVWAEVLRLDRVGIHDSFFDLGGHSMLVVQAHNRLNRLFPGRLSTMDLFRSSTVASLAQRIADPGSPPDADTTTAEDAAERQRQGRARQRARARSRSK